MKRIPILIGLVLALSTAQASAHAFLDHAVPAVGATIQAAPKQVQIFFTQGIEPSFSGATIIGPDGKTLATGAAVFDPQNAVEMVLNLPALTPGHYKVTWHVVSVDTHRTEGSFGFDIQP